MYAVREARALLTKTAPQGKITNGADAYLFDMRGPALVSALCDENEQLRSLNQTQAESIAEFQREQKELREAAQKLSEYTAHGDDCLVWSRRSCDCGLAECRSAITPKGSE